MKEIREVVMITGLSKRTLQYYDNIGLMIVPRSELNYRVYTEKELDRLWEIIIYKEMGMELNEIWRIVNSIDKARMAETKLNDKLQCVEEQIQELQKVRDFMKKVQADGIPSREEIFDGKTNKTYKDMAKELAMTYTL